MLKKEYFIIRTTGHLGDYHPESIHELRMLTEIYQVQITALASGVQSRNKTSSARKELTRFRLNKKCKDAKSYK